VGTQNYFLFCQAQIRWAHSTSEIGNFLGCASPQSQVPFTAKSPKIQPELCLAEFLLSTM
jgi:hypothetical protein